MNAKIFFPLLSLHFLFILNVLIVVPLKVMKLGKAMALGTHFVDSKHDEKVDVYLDIIIIGRLPLTIRLRAFSIFVCSVIRSKRNTSISDAGQKEQNSL